MINYSTNKEVEQKLVLLYTYYSIGVPAPPIQVSEILLRLDIMDYFAIATYTSELLESDMLVSKLIDDQAHYGITSSGINTLMLFKERIDQETQRIIDQNCQQVIKQLKAHQDVLSHFTDNEDGSYEAHLSFEQGHKRMIDMTIYTQNKNTAKALCDNWKSNAPECFNDILNKLLT